MQNNIEEWFKNGLVARIIPGFPYPERYCPYCERECELVAAIHLQEEMVHYKALYMCYNPNCGAYDEPAKKAYARVYYSSEHAYRKLELTRIFYDQPRKS